MAQLADDLVPRSNPERSVERIVSALMLALMVPQAGPTHAQARTEPRAHQLVAAAVAQTRSSVTYDGSYRRIPYPGGDVPETIGVCTDVVIRAYRRIGVDLQVKVHEDMRRAFRSYPQLWGMSRPDPNIDHRRVPNLQTFLRRAGAEQPVSRNPAVYRAGDLVTWMLPRNLPHIGISPPSGRPRARRSWCTTSGAARKSRTSFSRTQSPDTTATPRNEGLHRRHLRHLSY